MGYDEALGIYRQSKLQTIQIEHQGAGGSFDMKQIIKINTWAKMATSS